MEAPNETPNGQTENADPDPDLAAAVGAVDPADKVDEIQSGVQERAEEGDPDALKQVDLQSALREAFGYVNKIGAQVSPEFEHASEELDNLAVLWSEVLKDVEREKLMRFIERMPLFAASAYTVVTTGPKVRDAIQDVRQKNATLESPSNNNDGSDHANE